MPAGPVDPDPALPLDTIADVTPIVPALGPKALHELRNDAPDPVRVRVPTLGVDARVAPVDVGDDRRLPVPKGAETAGWWRAGPEPGERGPAVIIGHVDSHRGPAVFYRLRELRHGDLVQIDRVDGTVATFTVDRVERHDKDRFPTDAVYGSTQDSQLRLVTCGGEFDRSVRSYRDNVIVYAIRTG